MPLPASIYSLTDAPPLDWWPLVMGLAGGLALFLFGLEQLTDALRTSAGESMRTLLNKLTTNRFTAAITGAVVTAIIQSSSVTTVLIVGFVTAGLMTLPQAIGVIMGANIGSTVTAQLIAFKVTEYALLLIAVGFLATAVTRRPAVRRYGTMIMGLGLLFFGMGLMSDATADIRDQPAFLAAMQHMRGPAVGILVGAVFTAIVQSSAATTGILIVFASQGLISLEAGIALAFGANIGTCITAMLATLGKPRIALQAALVHVLFNIAGVLVWLAFIDQLADAVRWLSPTYPHLDGVDRLAAETPRQIANAHTAFNVLNTLLFIGMVGPFARLVQWLVPVAPEPAAEMSKPQFLDEDLIASPALAIDRARLELARAGQLTQAMLDEALPMVMDGDADDFARMQAMDDPVDHLTAVTIAYLGQVNQMSMGEQESERAGDMLAIATFIENVADIVETNLTGLGRERLRQGVHFQPDTRAAFAQYEAAVLKAFADAIKAMHDEDIALAEDVISRKSHINKLAAAAIRPAARHVTDPSRLDEFRIASDSAEYFKRVYYFAKRIAKALTEQALEADEDDET